MSLVDRMFKEKMLIAFFTPLTIRYIFLIRFKVAKP